MPHVGVQGLGPRHTQKDRAQCDKGQTIVIDGEIESVTWQDGLEDHRVLNDLDQTGHGNDDKPAHHDRAEYLANVSGAAPLHDKQQHQYDQGN